MSVTLFVTFNLPPDVEISSASVLVNIMQLEKHSPNQMLLKFLIELCNGEVKIRVQQPSIWFLCLFVFFLVFVSFDAL